MIEALTGSFDDHHAELARMLLDQVDGLSAQIGRLTTRIEEQVAAIAAARGIDADGSAGPGAGLGPGAPALRALDRLDEIRRISRRGERRVTAACPAPRSAAAREDTVAQVGQRGRRQYIVAAVTHEQEGSHAQVHGFPR